MNVKTLCLGILYVKEATGYEINKMASDGEFSHFIEASYGSIYPALTRMTEEGFVTWREEAQPGKPSRKVYAITDEGRAEFARLLQEPPKPDLFKSEFLFLCIFAELLPKEQICRAYEAQISHLKGVIQLLKDVKEMCDEPGSQFAVGYGLVKNEASLAYLEKNFEEVRRTGLRRETAEDAPHNHLEKDLTSAP